MQPKTPSNPGRRKFLIAATSVVGAGAVVGAAIPFVAAFNPSEQAKAAGAPAKADISKLSKGEMMLVEWRGIPIYIIRHTEESLAALKIIYLDYPILIQMKTNNLNMQKILIGP